LPEVIESCGARVVYACGPMGMLDAVTRIATVHGAVAQVAVEEAMACGVGVCMTCVLPVRNAEGRTRMVRSCLEGPVFRGDRIRWDAFAEGLCTVPDDTHGAAGMRAH
jgi:dihydroorotate dehydrogenase electron transfer subunit